MRGPPDGDFLDLDYAPEPAPGAPIVVLLHGLEGSTRRGYMSEMFRQLFVRGLRGVGMNFRGCGGEPNRVARFYHSGETGDLAHVVAELRGRHPGRPVGAAAFSLGGNVLLKHLGERGHDAGIAAAVAVSVPYDLAGCAARLSGGLAGRTYGSHFLRALRRKVRAKRGLLEGAIPEAAVAANPHIMAAFTDRGGHLGFVEGAFPRHRRFWAERVAARFLAGRLL